MEEKSQNETLRQKKKCLQIYQDFEFVRTKNISQAFRRSLTYRPNLYIGQKFMETYFVLASYVCSCSKLAVSRLWNWRRRRRRGRRWRRRREVSGRRKRP